MIKTKHADEVRALCKHGVASDRNFLMGTPICVASERQMNHAYTMMMYMLGTAAMLTKSLVETFRDSLAQYPTLYRQRVKSDVNKAVGSCGRLEKEFLYMASVDKLDATWKRVTGTLIGTVSMDIMKLRFAIRNEVGKHDHEMYGMKADFVLAYEFSKTLMETADGFGRFLHDDIGMGETAELSQRLTIPIRGIHGYLSNLKGPILGDEIRKAAIGTLPIRNGFDIVCQKILNWKSIEEALGVEAEREGINTFEKDNEELGGYIDNRGGRWNSTQDRILELSYGRLSDDDLAYELGRTKAAIRARARKLGLRKEKAKG